MPAFHTGSVTRLLEARPGLQRVLVDLRQAGRGPEPERAYVLTEVTGPVRDGDRVVVNTTAVDLGLGTGGWHVVHWNLERESFVEPGPGHIMKLRYTSLQIDTGAAEEHHPDRSGHLAGLPVAVCGLHSQMAVVAAACKTQRPEGRLVYVMTDGAALPLALSDLVVRLRERDVLDATVTAGNAFGGDLEAVTVASALMLAREELRADAVVVAMGPGITGTGSRLGTTGIEVASILDLVAALEGRPLLVPRVSSADPRVRHQGVSHHTRTVLDLARSPVTVAAPDRLDVPAPNRVEVVEAPTAGDLLERYDLRVTTMGRGPDEDPAFFQAAVAAGTLLSRWIP
jgi:hypothetical protein